MNQTADLVSNVDRSGHTGGIADESFGAAAAAHCTLLQDGQKMIIIIISFKSTQITGPLFSVVAI